MGTSARLRVGSSEVADDDVSAGMGRTSEGYRVQVSTSRSRMSTDRQAGNIVRSGDIPSLQSAQQHCDGPRSDVIQPELTVRKSEESGPTHLAIVEGQTGTLHDPSNSGHGSDDGCREGRLRERLDGLN